MTKDKIGTPEKAETTEQAEDTSIRTQEQEHKDVLEARNQIKQISNLIDGSYKEVLKRLRAELEIPVDALLIASYDQAISLLIEIITETNTALSYDLRALMLDTAQKHLSRITLEAKEDDTDTTESAENEKETD